MPMQYGKILYGANFRIFRMHVLHVKKILENLNDQKLLSEL